jgi:replication factor C subunit 3/5
MSDFEDDDMDIDGPPSKSFQFTSNNTDAKGKRIVADLPVEAEDNLPWLVSLPQPIQCSFDRYLGSRNIARIPSQMSLGIPTSSAPSTVS